MKVFKKIHTSEKKKNMQTHTLSWPMSYARKKKGKVSRVSEAHSSMTRMNLWGFGQKNPHQYFDSNIQYYSMYNMTSTSFTNPSP